MAVYQGYLTDLVRKKEERQFNAADWHYLGEHHAQALIARLLRNFEIHPRSHSAFLRSVEAGLFVLEMEQVEKPERIYYLSYRATLTIYRGRLAASTVTYDGVKVVYHG